MVRALKVGGGRDWDDAPKPILVVEVLSGSTRQRDLGAKRDFYLDIGAAESWVIDPKARTVRVIRRGTADQVQSDEIVWQPVRTGESLVLRVPELFE